MKKEHTVLLVLMSIILAVFIFSNMNSAPEDRFEGLAVRDFEKERVFWGKRMNEVGSKKAYEEFKEEYKDLSYGKQHTLSHLFGELLYKKDGIDGVAVCDSSFAFGCYHSFFGFAISENGLSVIHDLDQACIAAYGVKGLGCPHGIGHGVLSFVGYDKLGVALNECSTLTWKNPIGGCTSGVFMEYNFLTMEDPLGVTFREVGGDAHFPCNSVEDRFKEACYFEQPAWWQVIYSGGYEKVGELCTEAQSTKEREACFRGTGNVIAGTKEYDIETILGLCALMPSHEGVVLCRQGAAWITAYQPEYEDVWESLCVGLTGEDSAICLSAKELI